MKSTSPIQQKLNRFTTKVIWEQIALVVVLVVLFGLLSGRLAALSAMYAGGICVFCNSVFARKVFSTTGAHQSRQIMNGIYWGEAIKLLSSGILFAIVMKYGKIHPVAFFATLVLIQFGYFACLLLQKSPTK